MKNTRSFASDSRRSSIGFSLLQQSHSSAKRERLFLSMLSIAPPVLQVLDQQHHMMMRFGKTR